MSSLVRSHPERSQSIRSRMTGEAEGPLRSGAALPKRMRHFLCEFSTALL
jgi:hypothetical protein